MYVLYIVFKMALFTLWTTLLKKLLLIKIKAVVCGV